MIILGHRGTTLIARFVGSTWGPSGADRTQVGPMLAPWTLLSGNSWFVRTIKCLSQHMPNWYFVKNIEYRMSLSIHFVVWSWRISYLFKIKKNTITHMIVFVLIKCIPVKTYIWKTPACIFLFVSPTQILMDSYAKQDFNSYVMLIYGYIINHALICIYIWKP